MTDTAEPTTAEHPPEAKILRTLRGYVCEWGYEYFPGTICNADRSKPFSFVRGCFDRCIARRQEIRLTRDLDGKSIFARTGDNTLVLTSDDVGLMAHAVLLDNPLNRELCELIDAGKIRGWSHKARPIFGGMRVTKQDGVTLTEHLRASLLEVTLVIKKLPRARTRQTPIFFMGGPGTKEPAHV